MRNKIKWIAIPMLAIATGSLAGCASYTIQPAPPAGSGSWGDNTNREGYIFYEPELYFLVTSAVPNPKAAAAPVLNVTPVYLPNPNKPYRVSTHNFLAKSDFTFNFKDGWQLTAIDDKADNSSVTTALAGQMKTLLDAATKSLTPTDQPLPKTFLLHPEFDAAGIITNIVPVNCKNFSTE